MTFYDKLQREYENLQRTAEWVKDKSGLYICSHCGSVCPYDAQGDVIEYWECFYCPKCGYAMNK